MNISAAKFVFYASVCILVGASMDLLAQPFAIATSRGLNFVATVTDQVHDDLAEVMALPFKFIPFVGLGLCTAWEDRRNGTKVALISLLLYLCAFTLMYLYGFFAAERVFKNGYRTAAALNAGLPWLLATLSLAGFPLVSLGVRRLISSQSS